MNVLIVRTHQSGFTNRLEIAGSVTNDMADDGDASLPGQCSILGVGGGVQFKGQQLVCGGEILGLQSQEILWILTAGA